jgi:hypothetical protein
MREEIEEEKMIIQRSELLMLENHINWGFLRETSVPQSKCLLRSSSVLSSAFWRRDLIWKKRYSQILWNDAGVKGFSKKLNT